MTPSEKTAFLHFVSLVKNMRNRQKQYFASRSTNALVSSKQFERLVDLKAAELVPDQENLTLNL